MRAAIYSRSSKEARDVSCASQEAECHAWCQSQGWEVAVAYTDAGLSSTRDTQEALVRLLDDAKRGAFQAVVVYDTARFGRDQYEVAANLYHLEKRCGVSVHFVRLPSTGDPMDAVIRQIVGAFDQMHSLMSAEGARRGQRQNVRQGYRAGGSAPYGYRLSRQRTGTNPQGDAVYKSRLEMDEERAPVIAEFFHRRATGEGRRSIAEDFTRRGIPTPTGGVRWHPSTLRAFEDNRLTYAGHLVYGQRNARLRREGGYVGGVKWLPPERWEVKRNAHPSIINEALALKVGAKLRPTGRRVRAESLLSGLLACGLCGEPFWAKGDTYGCASVAKWGRDACGAHEVGRLVMERAARDFVTRHLLSPDSLAARHKGLERYVKGLKGGGHARGDGVAIRRLEKEISRLTDLYASGGINEADFRREYEPRRERLEALRDSHSVTRIEEWRLPSLEEYQGAVVAWAAERFGAERASEGRAFREVFECITLGERRGGHRRWVRPLTLKGFWPESVVNLVPPRGLEPRFPA